MNIVMVFMGLAIAAGLGFASSATGNSGGGGDDDGLTKIVSLGLIFGVICTGAGAYGMVRDMGFPDYALVAGLGGSAVTILAHFFLKAVKPGRA